MKPERHGNHEPLPNLLTTGVHSEAAGADVLPCSGGSENRVRGHVECTDQCQANLAAIEDVLERRLAEHRRQVVTDVAMLLRLQSDGGAANEILGRIDSRLAAVENHQSVIGKAVLTVTTQKDRLREQLSETFGPEDVARNAFVLLRRLDATNRIKPPSVVTVFRLYCMEALSASQVAARCKCAKATVINRLRIIEEQTGHKAKHFRELSGHFARIKKQMDVSEATSVPRMECEDEENGEEEDQF